MAHLFFTTMCVLLFEISSEDDYSDIDLFLDSNRQITGFDYFELKAFIQDALGCEIDLISDVDCSIGVDFEYINFVRY